MRFDIYSAIHTEVKSDDNTVETKSIRKEYRNLSLDDAKKQVNEFLNNIPENATGIYLNVDKSYETQLGDAIAKELG